MVVEGEARVRGRAEYGREGEWMEECFYGRDWDEASATGPLNRQLVRKLLQGVSNVTYGAGNLI